MAGDFYTDLYLDSYGATAKPDGFAVEIDWDKDGSFEEYSDNVTSRVRGAISVAYGRDQAAAMAPLMSGTGQFALDNASRDYSPRNTASPVYGKVKPARPLRISRISGGVQYPLFLGHTDDSPINPDINSKSVELSAVDALAYFRGQNITTGLYRGIRTGEAIGFVLDKVGWPADARDLDPGATVIPWWWEGGTDALDALDKIVRSEGSPALLTVGSSGEIIFRDRHHRLTRAASLTSQSTWHDGTRAGQRMNLPFVYDEAWRNVINTGEVSVDVRMPLELQPVWTSEATITLLAGEQRVISAVTTDPFYDAVVPVVGTDFRMAAGSVSVSLRGTSGLSSAIVLTAIGGTAIVTGLQLRARPVQTAHTVQVSESDDTSIADFGPRSFPTDLPWCGPEDAQAILRNAVAERAQALPILSVRFLIGRDDARCAALLSRDLSDRVRVVESETVLDDEFFIESIRHEIVNAVDHSVIFGLELVPSSVTTPFRFDTSGQGFDDGMFDDGTDDAGTMFRFDSTSGHRFDEGVFAS